MLLQVKLLQGLKMIKIFKDHPVKTCLFDDFEFYESRQKAIQEKKARQQQFQKQARLTFSCLLSLSFYVLSLPVHFCFRR